MNRFIPEYSTVTFTDVWDNIDNFKLDLSNSPFNNCLTEDSVNILFYLLYARYGNNPIANRDINQWKFKMFSVMFQYGPTWEKRLDIQNKLRAISDDDLLKGAKLLPTVNNDLISIEDNPKYIEIDFPKEFYNEVFAKAIYNSALNPSTTPSTGSLDELTYINSQNTTNYKKSKMDAYAQLLELLEVDVTEEFLVKFKKCFKVFVAPEKPLLYVTDTEDEGDY